MFIYDEIIKSLNSIIEDYSRTNLEIKDQNFKEDKNQIIFKNDKAFELGGGSKYGFTLNLISTNNFNDEIILIGKDTNEINSDTNYARINIFSCDDTKLKEDNLYKNIRQIDYMKYQFALDGVMLRESAINSKESLLFSKKKISLTDVGNYLIKLYKRSPYVKNMRLILINLDNFKYEDLKILKDKEENITKALDHLVNKVKMDCSACGLKSICDDVSKLVEKDFKN
jgi:hypothetical protein